MTDAQGTQSFTLRNQDYLVQSTEKFVFVCCCAKKNGISMTMEQDLKTLLLQELPDLLQQDPETREQVIRLVTPYFAPRTETDSRFDRMMAELQRMREESERKWAEQKQESERKWAELQRMREESERKWQESQTELQRMREESERKWQENQAELRGMREESERRWQEARAESERKWQEGQTRHNQLREETQRAYTKLDNKVNALGARWGIFSEQSFRSALKGILEASFDVQVLQVNEYDDEGMVFGRPDQVELDVVIKNGLLILCEIKSSISKSEVYTFYRKVQFYEKRHQRKASQMAIISPFVDLRALNVIKTLGIHLYSSAEDLVLEPED